MDVIYWLIPLSIVLLVAAVAIFFWAVGNGQFEDMDAAAMEIIFDKDFSEKVTPENKASSTQSNSSHSPAEN